MAPLRGVELGETELFVATLLLKATTDQPIRVEEIIVRCLHERTIQLTARGLRKIIHDLRNEHRFPICSRKGSPAGYWWARSEAELEEFKSVFLAQALDELRTIHRMLKTNSPRLAGQLRLELALEE